MQIAPSAKTTRTSLRKDIAIVAVGTLIASAFSAYFQWSEVFYEFTRRFEALQLDELPIALIALVAGLGWLSWRRYRQTLVELTARQAAEVRLSAALAENRQFAQRHLLIQETERKRLARELHDELGQYLNAIKIDAVSFHGATLKDPDLVQAAGARIERATDHVHNVVYEMIKRLRPVGLEELGLVAALENCVDQWRQRAPSTQVTFRTDGDFDNLGEAMNLTLYRLVQEGLTNSFTYANAKHIDIALRREEEAGGNLILVLRDDGRGMDTNRSPGFGLRGMRERVEMMGGDFSFESAPGRGFTFEARLPLRSNA